MTANFFAILRDGDGIACRRVRVARTVQESLTEEFEKQATAFLTNRHRKRDDEGRAETISEDSKRISFFPIYSINDHSQVFEIEDYTLDPAILAAAKSPDSADPLELDDDTISILRALCASVSTRSSTKIYFQAFESRRLLGTHRLTFLQGENVFSRLDRPGFTVGDNIHAIYEDGTLLFRSFPVASRFVSLIDLFNEASNEKVEEVLNHKVLNVADSQSVVDHADTIMRKQFAAIAQLKVLDKVEPKKAKDTAKEFDIDLSLIEVRGKKRIEFPEAKKDQKELLTFLTEGYYKGPLTGTAYQSNSHRPKASKKKGK